MRLRRDGRILQKRDCIVQPIEELPTVLEEITRPDPADVIASLDAIDGILGEEDGN